MGLTGRKRLLVTGDRGFVGSRAVKAYADRYDIVTLPGGSLRDADEDKVARLLDGAGADVIVHTAAISDTGYCQAHEEESYRANVLLPLYIARHAGGARVILFSSDQVYTSCAGEGPFPEDMDLAPGTVYARHKLEMERRALDTRPESVLLRAGWMYDMPAEGLPTHRDLLFRMLESRRTGEKLSFSGSDRRGVTWVKAAADNLEAAFSLPGGVYNYGAENDRDMYETGKAMAALIGAPEPLRRDGPPRSLLMDMTKPKRAGLDLGDTLGLWEVCVRACGLGGPIWNGM